MSLWYRFEPSNGNLLYEYVHVARKDDIYNIYTGLHRSTESYSKGIISNHFVPDHPILYLFLPSEIPQRLT
jgi:hypothetical protein